jgi:transposase
MRIKTIDTIPVLSDTLKIILTSFSRSRSLPASLIQRSSIILLASQGWSNQWISKKFGLHYNHVATWRKRFMAELPLLRKVESSSPEKLSDEIKRVLSDQQRPGYPAVFTQEQILKIIDLACKSPSEFGYEVSHWSLNLLAADIIGSIAQINRKIRRFSQQKRSYFSRFLLYRYSFKV